ncbi:MAG: alpha/beta fold hydrolase [Solirubrobacterales bacterium]|nr:alpha/beta fold hydrolase [Solirubrobacterales bacterium]
MTFVPSDELYPFQSRWLQSSVGRVHYVDEGSGQPILMCHGNPTWSFLYRHVIGELRDRFRCVAVDYPGFGLSERPAHYGYTPAEHATVVGELVAELDLSELIVMGHDWGGPIGLSVACANPCRVAGLALGNTFFWPPDRRARMFSKIMSSWPLQRAIINRNLFVERILPSGISRQLSPEEFRHYRAVQPTPQDRIGVAELPKQIITATPFLSTLERGVQGKLADTRVLITYPMRDPAFPADTVLPRMRETFSDLDLRELPHAKHFFLEDAPHEVAVGIVERFA